MFAREKAIAPRRSRFLCALIFLSLLALGAEAATPTRVLILHSFGHDFAPFSEFTPAFRTELARLVQERVVFHETSLNAEYQGQPGDERPFIEFLRARYGTPGPDLVVTLGAPAAHFYLRHRERLFQDVPLLVAGVERRLVPAGGLGREDFVVAQRLDVPRIVENILQVLPETRTLGIIIGSSPLERFWLKQLQEDLAPLAHRVKLLWLSDLSLEQLRERVAALPPHSALFYTMFAVDAEGIPHESERALSMVRNAANAPVFGIFDSQLGEGVVGGPLVSQRRTGAMTAQHARRMLVGGKATGGNLMLIDIGAPVFDWRELDRWRIPESRLPLESEIRFRAPSLWQQHRAMIATGASIVLFQAALIAALLAQRGRRRRAETESSILAGRLLTAHEDERRRLARELHDDLTQRLARLAIDAGRIEIGGGKEPAKTMAGSLRAELARVSEDVHALSYRLHPAVLDELGLVEALQAECDRVSRLESIHVSTDMRDVPMVLPSDTALCVFRVAQEALRNVVRHASAHAVTVALALRDGGLQLAVSDDGNGFDSASDRQRASLGLFSMRERVRLASGTLDIKSTRGHGTTVVAWVPLEKAVT